jgi:hypothetical protein
MKFRYLYLISNRTAILGLKLAPAQSESALPNRSWSLLACRNREMLELRYTLGIEAGSLSHLRQAAAGPLTASSGQSESTQPSRGAPNAGFPAAQPNPAGI